MVLRGSRLYDGGEEIAVRSFHKLLTGVNVEALTFQLAAHPELWNANRERTEYANSPHAQVDDIWLRWDTGQQLDRGAMFLPSWLPAEQWLPAVRPLVHGLMHTVSATFLGGVFVTRIPPHAQVLPHSDAGGWHAKAMNVKLYLPVLSNIDCVNVCDGDEVCMDSGEVWMFNNLKLHSVKNDGDSDRITLIVCMRVE